MQHRGIEGPNPSRTATLSVAVDPLSGSATDALSAAKIAEQAVFCYAESNIIDIDFTK